MFVLKSRIEMPLLFSELCDRFTGNLPVLLGLLILWFGTGVAQAQVAPVITGQSPLSTLEETGLTITLGDLVVSDPDSIYPDDFTLSVQTGTNYIVVGATITPALDFNGNLSVPVTQPAV
jgi:hypothetical protein